MVAAEGKLGPRSLGNILTGVKSPALQLKRVLEIHVCTQCLVLTTVLHSTCNTYIGWNSQSLQVLRDILHYSPCFT